MIATQKQILSATPLAVKLVEAYVKDVQGDGCDLESGMLGPEVVSFLVGVDEKLKKAEGGEEGVATVEEKKMELLMEEVQLLTRQYRVEVPTPLLQDLVNLVQNRLHTAFGSTSQWHKDFPIDVLGNPMRQHAPSKWESAVWPSEKEEVEVEAPEGGTWEENVEVLLSSCPHTVRDMSGDLTGIRFKESLRGSLCMTFSKMQGMLEGKK